MSNCLQASAMHELADLTLTKFDQVVQELPAQSCSEFYAEARALDTVLLTIYRLAAICVRDENDLDKVAETWGLMVQVCDKFAKRLSILNQTHPDCGAEFFNDHLLDIRNKCRRLQSLHA